MNIAATKVSQSSSTRATPANKAGTKFVRQVVIKSNGQSEPIAFKTQQAPEWFRRLSNVQRRFGATTFLLVGGMLLVYGATVYAQQKWSQEYHKLENLQRYERRLITTNEMLKNQMATEAEIPATGLVSPNPATAIILQPTSQKATSPQVKPAAPKIEIPLGY